MTSEDGHVRSPRVMNELKVSINENNNYVPGTPY